MIRIFAGIELSDLDDDDDNRLEIVTDDVAVSSVEMENASSMQFQTILILSVLRETNSDFNNANMK